MERNKMLLALLDEYRKSTLELKQILKTLSQLDFEKTRDSKTKDPDCKSIQTVTFHIVQSGYTYANYINSINNRAWFEYNEEIKSPKKGVIEINNMLDFTENSFNGVWQNTNKEIETYKFNTRWNVTYDFEQLMEHAIVHVLRHRRQIELFLKQNQE